MCRAACCCCRTRCCTPPARACWARPTPASRCACATARPALRVVLRRANIAHTARRLLPWARHSTGTPAACAHMHAQTQCTLRLCVLWPWLQDLNTVAARGLASVLLPSRPQPAAAQPAPPPSPPSAAAAGAGRQGRANGSSAAAAAAVPGLEQLPLHPLSDVVCHLFSHPRCAPAGFTSLPTAMHAAHHTCWGASCSLPTPAAAPPPSTAAAATASHRCAACRSCPRRQSTSRPLHGRPCCGASRPWASAAAFWTRACPLSFQTPAAAAWRRTSTAAVLPARCSCCAAAAQVRRVCSRVAMAAAALQSARHAPASAPAQLLWLLLLADRCLPAQALCQLLS